MNEALHPVTTILRACIYNGITEGFEIPLFYTEDINDPNYIIIHKLKHLTKYMIEFVKIYESILPGITKIVPIFTICSITKMCIYKEIRYASSGDLRLFASDLLCIIRSVCVVHGYKLVISETTEIFGIEQPLVNRRTLHNKKLEILEHSDVVELTDRLNYTKIIPFDIRYCIEKNIPLPPIVKFLIKKLGIDTAGEIAAYVYVICRK